MLNKPIKEIFRRVISFSFKITFLYLDFLIFIVNILILFFFYFRALTGKYPVSISLELIIILKFASRKEKIIILINFEDIKILFIRVTVLLSFL